VIVMDGNNSIPLQALSASPTEIRARLGVVRPDAKPGPLMVGRGTGAFGTFTPAFERK
jgi:hypothetical protein